MILVVICPVCLGFSVERVGRTHVTGARFVSRNRWWEKRATPWAFRGGMLQCLTFRVSHTANSFSWVAKERPLWLSEVSMGGSGVALPAPCDGLSIYLVAIVLIS